jgi:hypothetical protein
MSMSVAVASPVFPIEGGALDLCNPDGCTMTLVQSGQSRTSVLGLDRPKRLLGGHCLAPDGIATQAAMDWIPGLSGLLADACRRQAVSNRPWFWLPPVALAGGNSDEARLVSRRIARLAGVPYLVMDVSRLQDGALSRSTARGTDFIVPPDPVVAIATSGCANPLVLVLGADQASDQMASELGDLLDRHSSARWLCPALGAVLDLSAITWMVATPNEHALPTSIYTRLRQLPIVLPEDRAGRMVRVLSVALEVMADHDLHLAEVVQALETMLDDPDSSWDTMSRCSAGALVEGVTRQLLRAASTYAHRL